MTDDAVDLSPLDPLHDAARFDARVRAAVRDGLAARRRTTYSVLDAWTRPALAAVAVVVVVSLPAIARGVRPRAERAITNAEILGVPTPLVDLVMSTPQPSLVDVADALHAGEPDGH